MPITPQRLLGGERNLVIMGGAAAGMFVFQIAPRMTGSAFFMVVAIGIAFFFAWMGLVFTAWRIDPWMSKTLPRFLSLPKYMPAHSTGAASDPKRRMIRSKGLKR